MAKKSTAKKPVLGWGMVSPDGDLASDVFANKIEGQDSAYYSDGYKFVRVQIIPYKK